jgi:mannosyltransferase OCH1-like enzyme
MSHTFPKIIWQTHNYSIEKMPEHLKMICANWINLNPGWEYRYVDNKGREEKIKEYPEIFEYYMSLSPVFQSDIWRYIVTYEYGGVYADMDSLCIMPIDYMLNNLTSDADVVLVEKKINSGYTNNANYICKKNSTVMKEIVNKINPKVYEKYKDEEWRTWYIFIETTLDSQEAIYEFSAASHSKDYKDIMPQVLEIDHYGKKTYYSDFIKENNLKSMYW